MDTPANQSKFVVCRCQNCDGHIEFDGSDFQKGETRSVECPFCKLETKIFLPVRSNDLKPTQVTTSPLRPKPPAAKPSSSQKELFSLKITNRAAAVFFALTTLCLALILAREEKAKAVLAAQLQQLQNDLQAQQKSTEVLAAQLKQLQNSQQVQNSQFQHPQTIIVRPESQGQHWQRMGLVP